MKKDKQSINEERKMIPKITIIDMGYRQIKIKHDNIPSELSLWVKHKVENKFGGEALYRGTLQQMREEMDYQVYTIKVYVDGSKEWYQDNELHRIDGPAIESYDGTKKWYQNGKLHRTDGPAIKLVSGYKEWYQDGVKVDLPKDNCNGNIIEINGNKYKLNLVEE